MKNVSQSVRPSNAGVCSNAAGVKNQRSALSIICARKPTNILLTGSLPNSVTLNDLERCNSPDLCVISPNSIAFGTDYVKVVKVTPTLSAAEM